MTDAIRSFTGEYRFLSNFYPAPVSIPNSDTPGDERRIDCPTVEHAYQASKTWSNDRLIIPHCPTPGQAKRHGAQVSLRFDWENVKTQVMLDLVRQKFAIPELRAKLLATGTAHLEEGNTWGDTYWGTVNGEGLNKLGSILMGIRREIMDAQHDSIPTDEERIIILEAIVREQQEQINKLFKIVRVHVTDQVCDLIINAK